MVIVRFIKSCDIDALGEEGFCHMERVEEYRTKEGSYKTTSYIPVAASSLTCCAPPSCSVSPQLLSAAPGTSEAPEEMGR